MIGEQINYLKPTNKQTAFARNNKKKKTLKYIQAK